MALRLDQEVDDLLDLMGGGPSEPSAISTASTSRAHPPSDGQRGKEKKKKRTKEKRKRSKSNGPNGDGNKRISYADTRLAQNCFEWPCNSSGERSLSLGSGLMHRCDGYDPDGGRYGAAVCKSCGRSGASHQLQFESEEDHRDLFEDLARIVVAARNARCMVGEYHPLLEGISAKETEKILPSVDAKFFTYGSVSGNLEKFMGRMLKELDRVHQFPVVIVSNDDVELLREKVYELIDEVEAFVEAFTACRKDLIERRLALMAASDVVYYRCYYMAAVAARDIFEGPDLAAMLPHPPTYFSCPGLAWDGEVAGVESLRLFLDQAEENYDEVAAQLDDATKKMLLQSWELQQRLPSESQEHSNPLLALWQSRFMETIRHVWISGYSRMKSSRALRTASAIGEDDAKRKATHINGQESLLQMHEASALSPRLAQWGDSIRDYPANFYAYAAPTEEALQCISDCVQSAGIQQILEAGAGTGYWSTLLRSHLEGSGRARVPTVVPYDIAPSSALANEYHGNIPPFTDVKKAESLSQALAASPGTGAKTALMLCYPPPSSDMAHQALSAHMFNGGQMVLHIGEWRGLTGDAGFEDLLRRNFTCLEKDVVPLPMWGSDATYLTIWRKKGSEGADELQPSHSPAIGYCSVEDCSNLARRRCRFARCIQYCNMDCYRKHSSQRRSVLAVHMLQEYSTNYEDDSHFMDLRQISTLFRATDDSDRPRKKRKKKRR